MYDERAVVAVCCAVSVKRLSQRDEAKLTPKNILPIRVYIKVQPNTLSITKRIHLRGKPLVLWRIARNLSLVRLRARRRRSSACDFPLVRPVAIDVATDTAAGADGLAILAPETVVGLGVDEA